LLVANDNDDDDDERVGLIPPSAYRYPTRWLHGIIGSSDSEGDITAINNNATTMASTSATTKTTIPQCPVHGANSWFGTKSTRRHADGYVWLDVLIATDPRETA
jgi:hypothetical protein